MKFFIIKENGGKQWHRLLMGMLLYLVSSIPLVNAATDMYMDIPEIPGGSLKEGHEGEIEAHSFEWGILNLDSGRSVPKSTARGVEVKDFSFVHFFDKASPEFFYAAFSNDVLSKATFSVYRSGGDAGELKYIEIVMRNVTVENIETGGVDGGETPSEKVSLGFDRVCIIFTEYASDGSSLGDNEACWDLQANTSF